MVEGGGGRGGGGEGKGRACGGCLWILDPLDTCEDARACYRAGSG